MKKFGVRRSMIALVALTLCIGVAFWLLSEEQEDGTVRIATGTEGGTHYPLGTQLAHILKEISEQQAQNVLVLKTSGGEQNIQLLCNPETENQADLAFVMSTALATAPQDQRDEIRALGTLYRDVIQVVVRSDSGIRKLADLRGKKVYIGMDGSGTKQIARAMLKAVEIGDEDYEREGDTKGFAHASSMLKSGELDAAIFCAGTPANAVREAVEQGSGHLINLEITPDEISTSEPQFESLLIREVIPAGFYQGQPKPVHTVATQVVLACRRDLDGGLASLILDTLFDNVDRLLIAHSGVQDIRFQDASAPGPFAGVKLHPGAERFWKREKEKLLVATGAITGKYYHIGKNIQMLLEESGVPARAIHTDGSVENASILADPKRPAIALMQYDIALATYLGQSRPVFGQEILIKDKDRNPMRVDGLRRIAAFDNEKLHVLVRADKLPNPTDLNPTVGVLKGQRVALGPEKSGTQILAQAVLMHHDVPLDSIEAVFLPIPQMVNQLLGGDIDAAFFVESAPSPALKTLLANNQLRLLSIDRRKIAKMLGGPLTVSEIDPGTYQCQPEGAPAVETIATRTALVTTEDLHSQFDIGRITKILFEGNAFLGVEGGAKTMAADLPSLPLHPAAAHYYREAGHLPSPPPFDWLGATWRGLASLVILIGGYQGILKLRRDRVANEIGRRVFATSVGASEPHSVRRLVIIRSEIDERVKRRWWSWDELDRSRWETLMNLIENRKEEAQENLTRALLSEIRAVRGQGDLDATQQRELCALEERSWKHLENGELDESQHSLLLKVILHESPGSSSAKSAAADG